MPTTKAQITKALQDANIESADQQAVFSKLQKDEYDVFLNDFADATEKEEFVMNWIASQGSPKTTKTTSSPTVINLEGIVLAPTPQPALDDQGNPDYNNARIAFMLSTTNGTHECIIGLKAAVRAIGYPKEYATDKAAAARLFAETIKGKGAFVTIEQAKAGQEYADADGVVQQYRYSANYVKKFAMDDSGILARKVQFANTTESLGDRAATLTPAAADLLKAMLL